MKVLKNYLYQMSYEVLLVLLPIITTPYVSRVLEPDGVGRYSLATTIANYFVVFGVLGTSNYGRRQVAYVRDDKEFLRKTFWEITVFRLFTTGFALVSYLLFVAVSVSDYKIIFYIEALTIIANSFDITWLFIGLESFKSTAIRSMIVKVLGAILIFLLVRQKSDLWLYTLIISGTTLLGQIILWIKLPKDLRKFEVDWGNLKVHLKRTIHLWLPSVAINIYTSLDKLMLGYMINVYEVGLYEQSQKIVKIGSTITTSLSVVMLPRVANLFEKNRIVEFKEFSNKALVAVTFIAVPMCFGLLGIRETLVPWFYGLGYEKIVSLLSISAWLIITLSWSSIFGPQVLVATGQEKKYTLALSISAVINLILNFILIPRVQSHGALISSVVAEYTGMIIMFVLVREYFDVSQVFRALGKYITCAVFMMVVVIAIGKILPETMSTTFLQILTGIVIYCVELVSIKDRNMRQVISIVRGKLCVFGKR